MNKEKIKGKQIKNQEWKKNPRQDQKAEIWV